MEELQTYEEPLRPDQLPDVLEGRFHPPTIPTGVEKEIGSLASEAKRIWVECGDQGIRRGTEADALFAPVLHMELTGSPRRILTDSRLWHWLATQQLSGFVKQRWLPDNGADHQQAVAQHARFLGRSTLNGVNRNALARLYWTAEATVVADDYDLTGKVLRNADLHLNIFERLFGLDDRLVRECVRSLHDVGEDVHRAALINIRIRLGTVVLEALDETDLTALVSDCLALARTQTS